jgi:hypothetical protein
VHTNASLVNAASRQADNSRASGDEDQGRGVAVVGAGRGSWAAADLDVYIGSACGWCWRVLSCWWCGFSYPFVGAAGFCQSGVCGFTL